MILLDTNSYTAFFNKDPKIKREIDKAHKVFLSVVSVGELLYGFKRGSKEKSNINDLNDFLGAKKVQFLATTFQTAVFYAGIKHHLRKQGTPIPDNDIWIAAQAAETNSRLVSYDRHFLKIPGLKFWQAPV